MTVVNGSSSTVCTSQSAVLFCRIGFDVTLLGCDVVAASLNRVLRCDCLAISFRRDVQHLDCVRWSPYRTCISCSAVTRRTRHTTRETTGFVVALLQFASLCMIALAIAHVTRDNKMALVTYCSCAAHCVVFQDAGNLNSPAPAVSHVAPAPDVFAALKRRQRLQLRTQCHRQGCLLHRRQQSCIQRHRQQ